MNLRELNLKLTKESLKKDITRDVLIIQTIHTIDELIKIINKLVANLRERYGYYAPRTCKTEDINQLLEAVDKKIKEDIAIEMNKEDLASIQELADEIKSLIKLKESQEKYLEMLTNNICPNLAKTATVAIAARLISQAGSLKHLAELPSSTIQVLGAEKALFRHLKMKAKAPKFGIIFAHPDISKAAPQDKGKAARKIASEISKNAKIDYFRGKKW
ncbi:MAG TPA: hypothetical protein VJI68_01235 [Candidatus Nanoarchaeia archaeon]|nr:hypothetical protein [Candidatus Nanoarchaeia archaeon]